MPEKPICYTSRKKSNVDKQTIILITLITKNIKTLQYVKLSTNLMLYMLLVRCLICKATILSVADSSQAYSCGN